MPRQGIHTSIVFVKTNAVDDSDAHSLLNYQPSSLQTERRIRLFQKRFCFFWQTLIFNGI